MPSVTFDGRSFMLDGRRLWLVAGTVPYARIPSAQWADRIHAAKVAGLNTILTPVFWNMHEARPGHFDFTGDRDIRRFVQLVGKAGLFCALRPGPFVGDGWDFGGLPAWLQAVPGVKLRTSNQPFLEACSRYITALADQVRELQVTSGGAGGPIVLVQNESNWTCGDDELAARYMGELSRYLREAGFTVPMINANNLWQSVEGLIDCWGGQDAMLSTLRQLSVVRPDQPRLIVDFSVARPASWGQEAGAAIDPWTLQRRLAEVLAGGGQFNVHPFHAGTSFGFSAGRRDDTPASFATGAGDAGAILDESGSPAGNFQLFRRLATFASRFGRVLSNADPTYQPVIIDPAAENAVGKAKSGKPATGGCAVSYSVGTQGRIAWVFGDDPARTGQPPAGQSSRLLLPNGSTLPVHLGDQAVAWCLFDVHLGGKALLDYCNLCAFGMVGRVFVCFGAAGARGILSINGSPIEVDVPTGRAPLTTEFEGITLVVCNNDQIDSVFLADEAVYLNSGGVTSTGQPIARPGAKSVTRIDAEGNSKSVTALPSAVDAAGERITLGHWAASDMREYEDGTSARYAAIPGPAELSALGSPSGYGWYRLTLRSAAPHKTEVIAADAGDRLHAFLDGEAIGLTGRGPGASPTLELPLKKGHHQLVMLAENLGRSCGGANLGEPKGLAGHLWEFAHVRPGKPKVEIGDPIDVLSFRSPLWEVRVGDTTLAQRVTWHLGHRKKAHLIVTISRTPGRALLVVNDKTVTYLDHSGPDRIVLDAELFSRGNNTLQIALLDEPGATDDAETRAEAAAVLLADSVMLADAENSLTAKAEWAFAKWEPPDASAFVPAKAGSRTSHGPTWWRAELKAPAASPFPLVLTLDGLTKGQVHLNGRHVRRYFAATAAGKPVPPEDAILLPASWLRPDGVNELLIFDEHGGAPFKCRAFLDESRRPILAEVNGKK